MWTYVIVETYEYRKFLVNGNDPNEAVHKVIKFLGFDNKNIHEEHGGYVEFLDHESVAVEGWIKHDETDIRVWDC